MLKKLMGQLTLGRILQSAPVLILLVTCAGFTGEPGMPLKVLGEYKLLNATLNALTERANPAALPSL